MLRPRFYEKLGFRGPLLGAHSGLWVRLGPRGLSLKPMRVGPWARGPGLNVGFGAV